jgi:hypothetical protein
VAYFTCENTTAYYFEKLLYSSSPILSKNMYAYFRKKILPVLFYSADILWYFAKVTYEKAPIICRLYPRRNMLQRSLPLLPEKNACLLFVIMQEARPFLKKIEASYSNLFGQLDLVKGDHPKLEKRHAYIETLQVRLQKDIEECTKLVDKPKEREVTTHCDGEKAAAALKAHNHMSHVQKTMWMHSRKT